MKYIFNIKRLISEKRPIYYFRTFERPMTIFKDFPGLENEIIQIKDIPRFQGPV
jgi:hypothetical protein